MHARGRIRTALLATLASLALQLAAPAAAAPPAAKARPAACRTDAGLDGSFLQLTRSDAQRPRADWERLFADMAAVGVKQVFVQWTWADGVAFYATVPAGADDVPVLDLLFELADAHGMRVWLGLAHDAGWWAGIDRNRPPTEVEVFLARRRLANVAVARALAPQVAQRSAFAGWYVPDEIDDKNWLGADRGALVTQYLTELGGALLPLVPGARIAVSGFAQGWGTPDQVAALWSSILTRAPIGLLLFQDGIGAGKLTLDELAIYLPLLRRVSDDAGKQLGIVVELFAQGDDGSGTTPGFSAVPAPLARVEQQLALAQRWASGPLIAFSVPNYMSDFAGAPAARLDADYRRWTARCGKGRGAR
jgi:hypothetical protein